MAAPAVVSPPLLLSAAAIHSIAAVPTNVLPSSVRPLAGELLTLSLIYDDAAARGDAIGLGTAVAAAALPLPPVAVADAIVTYARGKSLAIIKEETRAQAMMCLLQHMQRLDANASAHLVLHLESAQQAFCEPIRDAIKTAGDIILNGGVGALQTQMGALIGNTHGIAQQLAGLGAQQLQLSQAHSAQLQTRLQSLTTGLTQLSQRGEQHWRQWQVQWSTLDARAQLQSERMLQAIARQDAAMAAKDQQVAFLGRFDTVSSLFHQLQALGNPQLSRVAVVGEGAAKVAKEVSRVCGWVPGLAAPTGIAMLGPVAAITLASCMVLSVLTRNDDPVLRQLQQLATTVQQMRQEMHARLSQLAVRIDQHADNVFQKLDAGFLALEQCVRSEATHMARQSNDRSML